MGAVNYFQTGQKQPGAGGGLGGAVNPGVKIATGVGGLPGYLFGKPANPALPHYEEDRKWMEDYLKNQGQGPFMQGQSPYGQNYAQAIDMLQRRANGEGPSAAGFAFQQANAQNMNNMAALASGSRSAGAARQAQFGMQQLGQGAAHGYAQARAGEMAQAAGQLGGMLNGADAAAFQRERANQMSWLELLAQQLGLSKAQLQGNIAGSQQKTGLERLGGLMSGGGVGGAKLFGGGGAPAA